LLRSSDTSLAFTLRAVEHVVADQSQTDREIINRLWDVLDDPHLNQALGIPQNSHLCSDQTARDVDSPKQIRDAALQALHPKEVEEIAQLEGAEKVARQAVKHAQERMAKRAEMRQDPDGAWRHTSEPSPVAA